MEEREEEEERPCYRCGQYRCRCGPDAGPTYTKSPHPATLADPEKRRQLWVQYRAAIKVRQWKADLYGQVKARRNRGHTLAEQFAWRRALTQAGRAYGAAKREEERLRKALGLND